MTCWCYKVSGVNGGAGVLNLQKEASSKDDAQESPQTDC